MVKMLARNNELPTEDLLSLMPKDMMTALLNIIASKDDGWKILMAVFLTNKHYYSIFKDDSYTNRIFVNLNYAFINFDKTFKFFRLDKIKHILMANYLAPSKPYPDMKILLDKYQLQSPDPLRYNTQNITLLVEEKLKHEAIIKPFTEKAEKGLQITLPGGEVINSRHVMITTMAVLAITAQWCANPFTSSDTIESDISRTFIGIFGAALALTFIAEAIHQYYLNYQINQVKPKVDDIQNSLDQLKTKCTNRLKKHDINILFDSVRSVDDIQRFFKANKVLKDPLNTDVKAILNSSDTEEVVITGTRNNPGACTIL